MSIVKLIADNKHFFVSRHTLEKNPDFIITKMIKGEVSIYSCDYIHPLDKNYVGFYIDINPKVLELIIKKLRKSKDPSYVDEMYHILFPCNQTYQIQQNQQDKNQQDNLLQHQSQVDQKQNLIQNKSQNERSSIFGKQSVVAPTKTNPVKTSKDIRDRKYIDFSIGSVVSDMDDDSDQFDQLKHIAFDE